MGRIIKQFMYSRVAWFLGVVGWIWIAGDYWYQALSGGFTGLKMIQVVIATALALLFSAAFIVSRGWEKRKEEERRHSIFSSHGNGRRR